MLAGHFGTGCAFIKQSRDIDPRPGTQFTLAECYAKAGKYASAVEEYDKFLALQDTLPKDAQARQAQRVEISKQQRDKLITQVPWLTVVLPASAPKTVVVTMDDKTFASNLLGIAFAADPGAHRFSTSAPGGMVTSQEIDLQPGERRTLVLDVVGPAQEPSSSPEPEPEMPPGDTGTSKRPTTWAYVAGGIGIAGLATGAVTGIILLDKRKTVMDECRKKDGVWQCSEKGENAIKSAQNVYAPIATIAIGVGVAGVATAAILWLTTGSKSTATAGLVPQFAVHTDGAAAGVQGQF